MIAKISKAGEPASGKLDRAFWISKLQAGAQIPTFELTLPRLFPLFHGHKVGMLFSGSGNLKAGARVKACFSVASAFF